MARPAARLQFALIAWLMWPTTMPGGSLPAYLLFVAGAFAAKGDMDVSAVIALLSVAAIAGDSVNATKPEIATDNAMVNANCL